LACVTAVKALPAPHREGKRDLGDPRGPGPRDLADRERQIRGGHEFARPQKHRTVGVEAFRILAHGSPDQPAIRTRRKAAAGSRRTDIGEQIEPLAQLSGRIERASATPG